MTSSILVLGFGTIGRATTQAPLACGDRVRVAQRKRPDGLPAGADFCACDVFDAQSVRQAIEGVSQVVLAAQPTRQ
jgi:nucleoside-diphosphate-sugar epimerase